MIREFQRSSAQHGSERPVPAYQIMCCKCGAVDRITCNGFGGSLQPEKLANKLQLSFHPDKAAGRCFLEHFQRSVKLSNLNASLIIGICQIIAVLFKYTIMYLTNKFIMHDSLLVFLLVFHRLVHLLKSLRTSE